MLVYIVSGTLAAVGDLNISFQNSTVFLTWTAPFTLDISSTMIDITYNVSMVSSVSSLALHNTVIVTEFSYPLPSGSGCDNTVFTVTPVNEAGEGVPKSIPLSHVVKCKLISG